LRREFLRRVGRQHGDERVARCDVDEQEADQRNAQDDRDRVDEAPCDVGKHKSPFHELLRPNVRALQRNHAEARIRQPHPRLVEMLRRHRHR
jgi:hypothetical protein